MKWPRVSIGEIFDIARGGSPRPIKDFLTDDPDGLNWIMIGDTVEGSKYITETKNRIRLEGLKKSRMVHAGDFLLTNSMSFGRPYILKTSGCIHDGWLVLSPKDGGVHPDFFYYLLGSQSLYREFSKRAAGAVVKNLNTSLVRGVEIPLPPLAEQKRIAAILDAADALRAKRRESLAQLDTLLQSTFLDMFGDPVSNPKGWKMGVVGDLLSSASYGTSKKADEHRGAYPVLRMNNITYTGAWDLTSLKYIDLEDKELPKHLVHKGQILFNRTNSKELVGKTAVYRSDKPVAFAGYLVRGVVNEQADPEYVGAFMNTPQMKLFLQNKCKSIVGMANINAKEFQAIPIPKPPVDLQRRFAAIVESVEQQKTRLRQHLTELDTLFASLQQRAFNGEL